MSSIIDYSNIAIIKFNVIQLNNNSNNNNNNNQMLAKSFPFIFFFN